MVKKQMHHKEHSCNLAREEYGHHILVHSRKFPSLRLKFCIDWCVIETVLCVSVYK